ncbi:GTP-binding protein [Alginatibacterium sediminis]|uniref:GTP-binding protein n=2 Tax=Alginatibacterium sediminis TaxID=2164068 RepID=A0A420EI34_9ALTE|nr:GTP-binding protein [Alginatibacterium sediminis]
MLTGFLGVGKTSVIIELLKQKPEHETWAILVNEFGELGIDGSLFAANCSEEHGVFIQEIAGGCMCCSAALMLPVALNQLLKRSKPDRLIIEPSGIGHPKQVVKALTSGHYQGVLDLKAVITVLDARQLSDPRYLENDIYQQQLQVADLLLANKSELYSDTDFENLKRLRESNSKLGTVELLVTRNAALRYEQFAVTTASKSIAKPEFSAIQTQSNPLALGLASKQAEASVPKASPINSVGYMEQESQHDGVKSNSWRFDKRYVFDSQQITELLTKTASLRLKAVIITQTGLLSLNRINDELSQNVHPMMTPRSASEPQSESKIEFLVENTQSLMLNTQQLLACRIEQADED